MHRLQEDDEGVADTRYGYIGRGTSIMASMGIFSIWYVACLD